MSILDCRVKDLHLPLMVIVDFRGWRLLAASLIPLGHDTLVYGSSDGGAVINAKDVDMNAKVQIL